MIARAAGTKDLGYKEALHPIEQQSPGTKNAFSFKVPDRAGGRRRGASVALVSRRRTGGTPG